MPQPKMSVRAILVTERHQRELWKGITLFFAHTVVVVSLFVLICASGSPWLILIGTPLLGLTIAVLFVVGHDACHGALFNQPWLNRFVATVAFLPSLHLYSTWAMGHNRHHHNWTMLRGKDYTYTPLTPQEYLALSAARRWVWRFFHTVPGIGFYYLLRSRLLR
jgi:omega-6 fatty acid desaturase (delta-12 desaturase)